MTPEEMAEMYASRDLQDQLHLRHEAFYLFADVLLDRVGEAVWFYFGGNARSIRSHTGMQKNLASYAERKGLGPIPSSLKSIIDDCQERIGDPRDSTITHARDPRKRWGTMYSLGEANTWLGESILNPTESDKFVQLEAPREIVALANAYVHQILDYIEANRDKARLT